MVTNRNEGVNSNRRNAKRRSTEPNAQIAQKPRATLDDLSAEILVQMASHGLTLAEMKECAEGMMQSINLLECSVVRGGLPHLSWNVAGQMTLTEYVDAVEMKGRSVH